MTGRLRAAALLALGAAAAAAAGCARPEAPSGGPPDLTPPVIAAVEPESARTAVPRSAVLKVTFSKNMDRRSVEDYVFSSPPVRFAERNWKGRTLELVPQDSLRPNTTYLAVIGTGARDVHGNPLARAGNFVFSTGPRISPGRVSGAVTAVKQSAGGLFVWLYDAALHPDSSWGRDDPDYLGQTGGDGRFEILGLAIGPTYTAHVFADLNRNRSYDPESEYMLHLPRPIRLTDSAYSDTSLHVRYVDPKLPGSISGRVDTTLASPRILVRLEGVTDTTASSSVLPTPSGAFLLRATPKGQYRVYWFEDLDHDGVPDPNEPRGEALSITLEPGEDVTEVRISRHGPPVRKPSEGP